MPRPSPFPWSTLFGIATLLLAGCGESDAPTSSSKNDVATVPRQHEATSSSGSSASLTPVSTEQESLRDPLELMKPAGEASNETVTQTPPPDVRSLEDIGAALQSKMSSEQARWMVSSLASHLGTGDRASKLKACKLVRATRAWLDESMSARLTNPLREVATEKDLELSATALSTLASLSPEGRLQEKDEALLMRAATVRTKAPLYGIPKLLVAQSRGDLSRTFGGPLQNVFQAGDPEAQMEVLDALREPHTLSPTLELELVRLVNPKITHELRLAALNHGLGRAKNKSWSIISPLMALAQSPKKDIANAAQGALTVGIPASHEANVADTLMKALPKIKDRSTWTWAVKTVGRYGNPAHIPALQTTASTPDLPKWIPIAIQHAIEYIARRHAGAR